MAFMINHLHLGTDYKSKESKDRSKSRPKSQSRSDRSRKEKTDKNDSKGMPKIAQPPLGSDFIKVKNRTSAQC